MAVAVAVAVAGLLGCRGASRARKASRNKGTRAAPGGAETRGCGCEWPWLGGCAAAWLSCCVAALLCGCVDGWLCGCVAVLLCGRVTVSLWAVWLCYCVAELLCVTAWIIRVIGGMKAIRVISAIRKAIDGASVLCGGGCGEEARGRGKGYVAMRWVAGRVGGAS